MRRPSVSGFSLIELIVVLAMLGTILAIGAPRLSTPGVRMYANDVKALIEQARFEAIKRSMPVAVVFNPTTSAFETRLDPDDPTVSSACTGSLVLQSRDPGEYRAVSVDLSASTWGGSVVWLPSGQGRACNGSPSIGGSIAVTDGRLTRTIVLTVGGRVTLE